MESYKHLYAKKVVADWFKPQTTFLEYPICADENNKLIGLDVAWHKTRQGIPSYQGCLDVQLAPLVIFDIAIIAPGGYLTGIVEVVNKHGITDTKRDYLRRVGQESVEGVRVQSFDADWVMSRCGQPDVYVFLEDTFFPTSRREVAQLPIEPHVERRMALQEVMDTYKKALGLLD